MNKKYKAYVGEVIGCYLGHSLEREIRWNASSGGLVSSILIYALKDGLIDGAVVTKMSETDPFKPQVLIARSEDEVLSACGSKYCPVSVNQALRDILNKDGRYAVVGLPCHIRRFRHAESLNRKLEKRTFLHLGLFCSHTVNFQGTELLLKKIGLKWEDVTKFTYRSRGWPGNLIVKLKNTTVKLLPFIDYWGSLFSPFFFTPMRCMVCPDATNELADISFGDAWLPEIRKKDSMGTSVAITRTRIGEELLRRMESKGAVELENIDEDTVVKSQWASLVFKKKTRMERVLILNFIKRKPLPMRAQITKTSVLGYACALIQLVNAHLSARKPSQTLLEHIPFTVLKGYSRFVAGIHYLCWKLS